MQYMDAMGDDFCKYVFGYEGFSHMDLSETLAK